MIYIILMTIFLVFLIITLSLTLYLLFSKSQKVLTDKKVKEANHERKKIISEAYKEINDQKKNFEESKKLELAKIETQKEIIQEQERVLIKQKEFLNTQQETLNFKSIDLEKRIKKTENTQNDLIRQIETVANLSQHEAKQKIMENVEQKIQHEIISEIKKAENLAHQRSKELANSIILTAMEKFKTDIVSEKTTSVVKLENDDLKGWIIGKDGRNTKTFEQFGGVEIIVDDTPNVVTISCFNPIRREIATKALEVLLKERKIQPVKIEKELKLQEQAIEDTILETGYKTVNELNIVDMDKELVKLIGRLKYRTSYGQNVLTHSIEVAKIASSIASELGLSAKTALRAGLLHDIGKAVDFEKNGSHVILGVEIARKYGENAIVINSIEAHHDDVAKESEIAIIVSIADAISASRPGARNNSLEDFFIRMSEIEAIGNKIPGIARTYAFQSGRQIRIIVDPITTDETEMFAILEQFKNDLENKVIIPGQITITAIREKREVIILN